MNTKLRSNIFAHFQTFNIANSYFNLYEKEKNDLDIPFFKLLYRIYLNTTSTMKTVMDHAVEIHALNTFDVPHECGKCICFEAIYTYKPISSIILWR